MKSNRKSKPRFAASVRKTFFVLRSWFLVLGSKLKVRRSKFDVQSSTFSPAFLTTVDSKPPHGFSPFGHVAFAVDSKPPHGFSPFGHVAFAPVQTAYKPSAVLSKRPTSLQPFSPFLLAFRSHAPKVQHHISPAHRAGERSLKKSEGCRPEPYQTLTDEHITARCIDQTTKASFILPTNHNQQKAKAVFTAH